MSDIGFKSPGSYVMIKIQGLSLEMLLNAAVNKLDHSRILQLLTEHGLL